MSASRGRAAGPSRRAEPGRGPIAGSVGLSLAGGGPAGAIYEIGALWALQEALDGVDLAALPCYVGVSAGALVAACLANGMTPRHLVRVVHGDAPGEASFAPEIFFAPNYREFVRRGVTLPHLLGQALYYFTRRRQSRSLLAALSRATRALPLGIFDNEPIRHFLKDAFARPGRTDDFRALPTRLVVVAADLETGRPVRLGLPEHPDVPISRAVQASAALPGIYPPVLVDGHACVDGVLLKTLHASVALDQGVGLLLCVNPLAPIDTTLAEPGARRPPGTVLEHGLTAVLSQTFRTLVHSRLEVGLASYADRYPGADVVLFEPAPDAHEMFFANLFSLEARHEVCAFAYHATRADLRRRAEELAPVLARHGVRIRLDVLDDATRVPWTPAPTDVDDAEATGARRPRRTRRARPAPR